MSVQVKEITGGRGVDYAIEVIGSSATMKQAYYMVRQRGAVIAVGVPAGDATLTIPIVDLQMGEKQIRGCLYGSAQVAVDMPRLIGYAEGGSRWRAIFALSPALQHQQRRGRTRTKSALLVTLRFRTPSSSHSALTSGTASSQAWASIHNPSIGPVLVKGPGW